MTAILSTFTLSMWYLQSCLKFSILIVPLPKICPLNITYILYLIFDIVCLLLRHIYPMRCLLNLLLLLWYIFHLHLLLLIICLFLWFRAKRTATATCFLIVTIITIKPFLGGAAVFRVRLIPYFHVSLYYLHKWIETFKRWVWWLHTPHGFLDLLSNWNRAIYFRSLFVVEW